MDEPLPLPPPMAIDGADEDLLLSNSRFMTRREVIVRRLRRSRQLYRCYRGHYWALMDEMKSKYREYYWTYGKNPFKENINEAANDGVVLGNRDGNSNGNCERSNAVVSVGDDVVRCAFSGCKTKAMALNKFCHAHILSDSKQKLYKGCKTVAKNLPTGPSYCNKPILRSVVPAACPTHYQLGEKCVLRAVKRAGYNIPTNRKPTLKLHLLIHEFVRQIQNKRKVSKSAVPTVKT